MNIYDYAMGIELEGEALYRGFAERTTNQGMITIFTELADQENSHYEIIKKMKDEIDVSMPDASPLNNVNNVFAEWKKNKDKFDFDIAQADLYRKALDIEKKSIDFYTEKSEEVKDVRQKQLFLKIAEEENKHYKIIENIIEFITKPERWVENAEFTKIGEVY